MTEGTNQESPFFRALASLKHAIVTAFGIHAKRITGAVEENGAAIKAVDQNVASIGRVAEESNAGIKAIDQGVADLSRRLEGLTQGVTALSGQSDKNSGETRELMVKIVDTLEHLGGQLRNEEGKKDPFFMTEAEIEALGRVEDKDLDPPAV